MTATDSRPPEGWGVSPLTGRPTFVQHGASFFDKPPQREGFKPHFIARYGVAFTRWTYKEAS